MRVEVRSVAPDANPYLTMYSISKPESRAIPRRSESSASGTVSPRHIYTALNISKCRMDYDSSRPDVKGRYVSSTGVGRQVPARARHLR